MSIQRMGKWIGLSFFLVLATATLYFLYRQGSRPAEIPLEACPELPGSLDPRRLVVLGFDGALVADAQQAVFLEDIEELLLSAEYQVLPASSEAANLPDECIPWKLEFSWRPEGASLAVRRRGKLAQSRDETRAKGKEAHQPMLRGAVVETLELLPRKSSPSLHDPDSPLFERRLLAMRLYSEGRTGEAAAVLREAVGRDDTDPALAFRLGRVAAAWAFEKAAIRGSEFWRGESTASELEAAKDLLFTEALLHLERALAIDSGSALSYFYRGQVKAAKQALPAAERDFRQALALWPAYGEAANELAKLEGQRDVQEDLEPLLERSLRLIDRRRTALRGELLGKLGNLQLREGRNDAAAAVLEQALGATPAERRYFRLELLAALTQAQLNCGKLAEACANWRAYELLAGKETKTEVARRAAFAAARLCR